MTKHKVVQIMVPPKPMVAVFFCRDRGDTEYTGYYVHEIAFYGLDELGDVWPFFMNVDGESWNAAFEVNFAGLVDADYDDDGFVELAQEACKNYKVARELAK